MIKEAWKESGKVYCYRKLHDDLCNQGLDQIGYKRCPGKYGGKPLIVVDNTLNRRFDVDAPDRFWMTDITYIKTYEGSCIWLL